MVSSDKDIKLMSFLAAEMIHQFCRFCLAIVGAPSPNSSFAMVCRTIFMTLIMACDYIKYAMARKGCKKNILSLFIKYSSKDFFSKRTAAFFFGYYTLTGVALFVSYFFCASIRGWEIFSLLSHKVQRTYLSWSLNPSVGACKQTYATYDNLK